jgi:antitoxin ChpS
MHTTNLRQVGGSVMLAVPPAILDMMDLRVGEKVSLDVEPGRLVVKTKLRPRYTMDQLLAQCDTSVDISAEEREWLDGKPVGSELL